MSLLTAAETEQMLRDTGGVTVVKGTVTTYGHVEEGPTEVLEGDGGRYGTVLLGDLSVVIANGILAGVSPKTGIDEEITVDDEDCTIIRVVPPRNEPSGDVLHLVLRRND